MTKIEVISHKPSKNWIFLQKWQFLTLFCKKNPQFWIFPWVPLLKHASRHLGEYYRKFSAKTSDQKLKLLVKTFKNWIFGKKWPFFDTFWPKNPQIWIFPRVPLLAHTSRYLEEDFRKFSAKNNDKNWSYWSKTFKKLDFWQK